MRKQPDNISVLELLGEHHEFMQTTKQVAVMEDNGGYESAWWSDYRLDEEQTVSHMHIKHFTKSSVRNLNKRDNIEVVNTEVFDTGKDNDTFHIIWANNCLQKSIDPFKTLTHWWNILKEDGMLVVSVPQTSFINDLSKWQVESYNGEYYSWNILNLIQALAVCGFDCRDGHFKQTRHEPYIWAAVYKGPTKPMDPVTTTWYDLREKNLIPHTLDACIDRFGYAKIDNLKVEWLNHSVYDIAKESMP